MKPQSAQRKILYSKNETTLKEKIIGASKTDVLYTPLMNPLTLPSPPLKGERIKVRGFER